MLTLSCDSAVPLVEPSLCTAPVAGGTFTSQQKHLKGWGSQFGITGFNVWALKSLLWIRALEAPLAQRDSDKGHQVLVMKDLCSAL